MNIWAWVGIVVWITSAVVVALVVGRVVAGRDRQRPR